MAVGHTDACTVWDLTTRKQVATLDGDLSPVLFTPDGLLILAGPDGLAAFEVDH